jgi:ribose transport system substrate-binding protein
MSRRTVVVAVATLLLTLALGTGTSGQGRITVGFSAMNTAWPWFTTLIARMNELARQRGWDLIVLNAEADVAKQASTMDDLIARKVKLIIVSPLDGQAIIPSLKKAADARIPVLTIGNPPADDGYRFAAGYVGPDDWRIAETGADVIAKSVKAGGRIAMLQGFPGQPATVARTDGFERRLKQIAPGLTIVARQPYDWDPAKAQQVAEDILTRFPGLDALWVHDDNAAAAVAHVLRARNLKPVVVAPGGSRNGVDAVCRGELSAVIRHSPVTQADEAFRLAAELLAGRPVPRVTRIENPVITRENCRQYPGEW